MELSEEVPRVDTLRRLATPDASSSAVVPSLSTNSSQGRNLKIKKAATITPRSFRRFFTLRSSQDGVQNSDTTTRNDSNDPNLVGRNEGNRQSLQQGSVECNEAKASEDHDFENVVMHGKKRSLAMSLEGDPETSGPVKRFQGSSDDFDQSTQIERNHNSSQEDVEDLGKQIVSFPKPIVRSRIRGALGTVLRREEDVSMDTTRRAMNDYCGDWQAETTAFYSQSEDYHYYDDGSADNSCELPFSVASCNTNSLVAVGYEGGAIRMMDSYKDSSPGFKKPYLTMQPHVNAILDLAFSSDDSLLATASGDQTSQIIDMQTQRATYTLSAHVASVKHVRFQPGTSSVIATSSRDGNIQIWDLRCKGTDHAVGRLKYKLDPSERKPISTVSADSSFIWARSVNTIREAHAERSFFTKRKSGPTDTQQKNESISNRTDISITGLSFLTASLPHMLLTGSALNASVKLWDLRAVHRVRGKQTPLSTACQPESHTRHRQFGLTSMSLSGDGSRLYTLCRDHTIYAYSTNHLVLGHVPGMDSVSSKPRRGGEPEKMGLSPLYGFRHPKLHAATFYVKMAVRPAQADQSELLAVGSSDQCAILFPTDERHLRRHNLLKTSSTKMIGQEAPALPPSSSRSPSIRSYSETHLQDTTPIYQHGTALVRGHSKEVTAVSWTSEGELFTASDDLKARIWREDVDVSRSLRVDGEGGGRRHRAGWAECLKGWDESEL